MCGMVLYTICVIRRVVELCSDVMLVFYYDALDVVEVRMNNYENRGVERESDLQIKEVNEFFSILDRIGQRLLISIVDKSIEDLTAVEEGEI